MELLQIGLSREDAIQIIEETYPSEAVQDYARRVAKDLIHFLLQSEMSNDLHLLDELEKHNLVGA